MTDRSIAGLGILANLIFWPLMFGMAAMRSDYSHLHQAISELGSVGAPRMWVWNILGYIVPGLLLAAFGWSLVQRLRPRSRWIAGFAAIAGIGMALSGVFPADMEDRRGLASTLHASGVLMSLLGHTFSVVAIAVLARRKKPDIAAACLIALAASVGALILYGYMPHTPALVQRINFGVFFGWYLTASLLLLNGSRRPAS